jgi:hypothetical protein
MSTAIKDYKKIDEVIKLVTTLLTNTSIEMGLPQSEEFIGQMSTIFSNNLKDENKFNTLTIDQITTSFNEGVRFGKGELLFNIRTFYRWVEVYASKVEVEEKEKADLKEILKINQDKIDKATEDRIRDEDIKAHKEKYPSNKERQDKKD